ncbi:chymotrypsin-C-like [Pelobates fuscus]|uniref:chymotrypsin-C-like n=1 Tax=Pelobates fuscus TaxID=191477 RepID=UPI002FE4D864
MAFMTMADEKDPQNDEKKRKKRKGCCSVCCTSCCFCCIECLSGFILLLIVAGLVLCARIFLEFPVILNGFGRTFNFSSYAVSAITSESSSTYLLGSACGLCIGNTDPTHCNNTYQVYMGSFKLLNELYQTQYNDTSTTGFQVEAKRIGKMLKRIFNSSLVKPYSNASTFLISPDPLTAHVQLLFCNDSAADYVINGDAVAQVLKSFNGSLGDMNITMDTNSVVVGGEAPCPTSLGLGQTWPWQSVIQQGQTPICIGSLLAAFWVLVPASCVSKRDLSLLSVTLGSSYSANTVWKVANIIQNPNYTASPLTNDIALVLLSTPALFSSTIMPICLPQTMENPALGTLCSMNNGNISDALSTAGLVTMAGTVTSGVTCLTTSQNGITYISPTFTIASLIQVDVGSTLVCMGTNKAVYLQGITSSQQKSTSLNSSCVNYINIGTAIDWIKTYIID